VWRYDAAREDRALRGVRRSTRLKTEEATLLGLPRHRKERSEGTPRTAELPDDDLRLVRDGHGRSGRARVQDADDDHSRRSGQCRFIAAMGNMPIVRGPRVDMEPFWEKSSAR